MKCYKCNHENRGDAIYCQQCGTQARKVVLLRDSQSLALRGQLAGYYVGYTFCGLIAGVVLAIVAFLLFLFLCNSWGIPNPAGNSGALVVLVVFEFGVLSVYAALALRIVRTRVSKARYHLPLYRKDPRSSR